MEPNEIMELGVLTTVKRYPYRKAVVVEAQIILDRRTEAATKFEKSLAKAAGSQTDNHTVYEISSSGMPPLYVMCSDFKMSIGTKVKKEDW